LGAEMVPLGRYIIVTEQHRAPFLQDMACPSEKHWPQPSQRSGSVGRLVQPCPSPLSTGVSSVDVGVQPRPLAKRGHQQAGAGLGGCDAARGRLDWVWQAQAGLTNGNGRQLALALCFRRLQQSRQEDRPDGFLNRLKRRPAVGHDALEVLPLLLE
jgi:hypothetical protein